MIWLVSYTAFWGCIKSIIGCVLTTAMCTVFPHVMYGTDSFSHVSLVHTFGWAEQRPHFHCVIYPSSSPFILSICRAFYASFIVPRWFIWSTSYSVLSPHSWQKLTTRLNLLLSPSSLSHDTLCCLHIFVFFVHLSLFVPKKWDMFHHAPLFCQQSNIFHQVLVTTDEF